MTTMANGGAATSEKDADAPTAAELTTAIADARAVRDMCAKDLEEAEAALAGALDAKARSLGRGKIVTIGDTTYRTRAPRKPRGGEADPGALWTLEKVEVGE